MHYAVNDSPNSPQAVHRKAIFECYCHCSKASRSTPFKSNRRLWEAVALATFARLESLNTVRCERDNDVADARIERWFKDQARAVLNYLRFRPKRSLIFSLTNSKRLL